MKKLEYNNKEYYVNSFPKINKNGLYSDKPILIYMHKNFQGNPDYLSDAVSILDNLKQPSKKVVKEAMIWSIGYGGDHSYSIKAGGESKSDSKFSSHLKVTIAHPKTGYDTDVVVLKKYSNIFEDVLISEKEVSDLYKMCQTPNETKIVNHNKLQSCIHLLLRTFQNRKININGKNKIASKKVVDIIKNRLFENNSEKQVSDYIDKMISNKKEYLNISLNEESSSSTTEEFHKEISEEIETIEKFRKALIL